MLLTREITHGELRDLQERLHAIIGAPHRLEDSKEVEDLHAILFVAVPGKNPDLTHDLKTISESNRSPVEKAELRRQVLTLARENSMAALNTWNGLRYRENHHNHNKGKIGEKWAPLISLAWKHTKSLDVFIDAFGGIYD